MPADTLDSNSSHSIRLRMRTISKRFGATVALDHVSFDLRAGEVHALIGENGAGKSTLMKVLAGACEPDAGSMSLDGVAYAPRNPADGRQSGVGMIYQELSLAQHLRVDENILLGREPTIGPFVRRNEITCRASDALAQLGRPDIRLDQPVGALSAADQQLVEIARSVAVGCRVLVLDEPTSSLPRNDIERLFDLICRLRDAGLGIVYISHVLEEVREICDRYSVLRDGRNAGDGSTGEFDVGRVVSMMVGRTLGELYPKSKRTPGAVVLELQSVAGTPLPGVSFIMFTTR
jgi:ribose transport system ATP-binding protein